MSKISSGTTTATGLVQTSDTTGNLELQTNNGTTAVTFDTNQNASFAGDISVQGGNYLSSQPSFRNIIINGDMQISQRGTSFSDPNGFTLDRWRYVKNGISGVVAITQDTDTPSGQGFSKSLKIAVTTADTSIETSEFGILTYLIEGQHLQHLKYGTSNAKKITVSFWVKSNKTGTYCVAAQKIDATRYDYVIEYTINSANTWEKKTITITPDSNIQASGGVIDNDNGLGLALAFPLADAANRQGTNNTWNSSFPATSTSNQVNFLDSTSNYINITGVQLEVGENVTPFEHRPYDVELARCQRYFQSFGGNNVAETVGQGTSFSTTNTYVLIHLLQTMRSVPSLGYSAVGDWRLHYPGVTGQEATAMAIATNDSNNTKVIVNTTTATNASMGGGKCIQLTADSTISARLTFSAEL